MGSLIDKKIDVLISDKNEHKNEIIHFQKGMQRSIFSLITITAIILGLYWEKSIITDENSKLIIILITYQVSIVFALYALSQFNMLVIHSTYLAEVEKKINNLCEDSLCTWEKEITHKYILKPRSLIFWVMIFLFLEIIVLLIVAYSILFFYESSIWIKIGLILELVLIIICLALSYSTPKKIKKILKD